MRNLLLILGTIVLFAGNAYAQCTLRKPKNVQVSNISSCDAVIGWSAVTGVSYYRVRYRLSGISQWTYVNVGTDTNYTLTGLQSDTGYNVSVADYCSDNTTKGFTATQTFHTLSCSPPQNVTISTITDSSAVVSWQAKCNSSVFNLLYRISGTTNWTAISHILTTSYSLQGLQPNTSYNLAVQSDCGQNSSSWTDTTTFTTADSTSNTGQRPNVLVILMDDGRYDTFLPTGGPSWFQSPSINSIAYQGVNFKYMIPTTSQCAPSRVSIYTGLYGHHNGVLNNGDHMNDGLPLVQQILTDNGYYTGFVGKYGQAQGLPKGFSWWAISKTDSYVNPPYSINGKDTSMNGNILDTYPWLALNFLKGAPADKPWLLMFFTRAPHTPTVPRSQDAHKYQNDTMPFPSNFYSYPKNYPNFFYGANLVWRLDSAGTAADRLGEFQTLAGVEYDVDTLMSYLKQHGMLDNTIIFFTSDNGYLKGEHLMEGKEIMQEESIRLPFFVRYPAWFHDSTVISNQIVSNIDIAPTILEAAGIPNTYNMDGMSLHQLVNGQAQRPLFLYEFGGQGTVPPDRGVRSFQYKYVHHYCTTATEEFYDLVKDPHENTNQINNSKYAAIIQQYKTTLDSLRTLYGDSTDPTNFGSCFLKNVKNTREDQGDGEGIPGSGNVLFTLSPNPTQSRVSISFLIDDANEPMILSISNVLTQTMYENEFESGNSLDITINTQQWNPGLYLVTIQKGNKKFSQKMLILR